MFLVWRTCRSALLHRQGASAWMMVKAGGLRCPRCLSEKARAVRIGRNAIASGRLPSRLNFSRPRMAAAKMRSRLKKIFSRKRAGRHAGLQKCVRREYANYS